MVAIVLPMVAIVLTGSAAWLPPTVRARLELSACSDISLGY